MGHLQVGRALVLLALMAANHHSIYRTHYHRNNVEVGKKNISIEQSKKTIAVEGNSHYYLKTTSMKDWCNNLQLLLKKS